MDLFGFEQPQTPSLTDEGFEEFWAAYPKCVRKGEKSACKKNGLNPIISARSTSS